MRGLLPRQGPAVHARAQHGRGVVNVDDAWGRGSAAARHASRSTTVSAARRPAAPTGASRTSCRADGGSTFTARSARTACAVGLRSPLPGAFNVANTALGGRSASCSPATDAAARRGGPCSRAPAGAGPDGARDGGRRRFPRAVVDYAHTPDAVEARARARCGPIDARPLVVVLGCGGDRDRGKRAPMGAAAAAAADIVVVTDDNPRSEDPAAIRAAVLAGARAGRRAAAARASSRSSRPGRGDRRGRRPGAGAGRHRRWSRARATSRARRSPASCIPFDDRAVLARRRSRPATAAAGRPRVIAADAGRRRRPDRRAGRLARRRLAGTPPDARRSTARSSSTPARSARAALFVAFAGERVDGHDFAAAAVAAGAVAVLATRPVGVPGVVVVDDALAALGAARPRTCVDRRCRDADRRRRSPARRQDQHQGPDRAGARDGSGRPSRRPGSLNNEIGVPLTVLRADAGDPVPGRSRWAPAGSATSRYLRRIAPPRIGVVLNVGTAHVGEFGGREAIAAGQGRAGRGAAGRRASPSSTPTTRWCAAMADAHRGAACVLFGEVAGRRRPRRATSRSTTRAGRRFTPAHAGRAPADGRLAPARRAPRRRTRSPPPPSRSTLGMPLPTIAAALSRGRGPRAAGGWRSPSAPTA